MSDIKIIIGLTPTEAKAVLTAIAFTSCGCSKKTGEELEFCPESAEVIGLTAENLCELHDFYDRLQHATNEQAALAERNREQRETEIQNPKSNNQHPENERN
mgnify:CR=1 FL=1